MDTSISYSASVFIIIKGDCSNGYCPHAVVYNISFHFISNEINRIFVPILFLVHLNFL